MMDTPKSMLRNGLVLAATAAVAVGIASRRRRERHSDDSRVEDSAVGSRGLRALSPPIPYIDDFLKCLQDPCDARDNPQGYIPLCIAENKLSVDVLAERLMQPGLASAAFADSDVYAYNSFLGLPIAREAVAYFLATRFLHPDRKLSPAEALREVNPTHVALGSGCAALLNYLFYILGEEDQGCLIPAPYYAAFDNDMGSIARCKAISVPMVNMSLGPTTAELEDAYHKASKERKVKFLLLTNPNNPLGVVYKPKVVKDAIAWARSHEMHVIMDELYALSTRNGTFESSIRLINNDLRNDVHMIWALSKDFGASGFRVGTLYSQNELLMQSLANLNLFSGVSHPIQMVTAEMLTDDEWCDDYIEQSRQSLQYSYELCVRKLEEMVVPFIPAAAGIFVYADFSALLPSKTWEGEEKLSRLMMDHARLVLTPGGSQRERRPGYFRICYATVSPDILAIAMERLSRLVVKMRKLHWEDLNEASLQSVLR